MSISRSHVIAAIASLASAIAGCSGEHRKTDALTIESAESELTLSGVKVVGSITNGQARSSYYDTPPTYRAFSFSASGGDFITVDVTSVQGDAVAMITDAANNVLAINDDASPYTLDSRVTLTLPSLWGPSSLRIVFRDYNLEAGRFEVRLAVKSASSSAMCTYAGSSYVYGDEFAAVDGCNRCTCGVDGAVQCSTRVCACNPASEPLRTYVGTPDQCLTIRYTCGAKQRPFSNACGCGCEPVP
jgi:hypothetical protein